MNRPKCFGTGEINNGASRAENCCHDCPVNKKCQDVSTFGMVLERERLPSIEAKLDQPSAAYYETATITHSDHPDFAVGDIDQLSSIWGQASNGYRVSVGQ